MRQPITLKIKFKSGSLDQFIERYSVDVSRGGIFIRTKEPLQVGTGLKFEFQLQDASALISGEGTVVWIREHDPARTGVAPGMGVRFDKLAPASAQVLDQILAEKSRRGEANVESRFDAGARAQASVSGTTGPKRPTHDFDPVDSKAGTPLPKPAPGFESTGAEEFGQESTRVMQDDVVQALAQRTRGADLLRHEDHGGFSDEPTRARSPEEIESLVRASGPINVSDEVLDRTNVDDKKKPPPKPPVISSAPRPVPSVIPPPPPSVVPPPLPPSASAPSLPAAVAAPPVTAAPPIGEGEPTFTDRASTTLHDERPPERKKGSPLPALLAVCVVAAAAVGYFVFMNNPPTDTPAVTAQKAEPEAQKAEPEAQKAEVAKPEAKTEEKPEAMGAAKTEEKPEAKTEAKGEPKAEPANPAGPTVEVTSEPPGATVFVDGKEQGTTPAQLADLDPKKPHEVKLALKGYHELKLPLAVKAGAKLSGKLVANEKVVEVSSTPTGADVFVDGKRVGKTPFAVRKFDVAKEHEVEVRHAGFAAKTQKVTAGDAWESKPDGRDVLPVALALVAEAPKPAPHPQAKRPAKKEPAALPTVPDPNATPKPTEPPAEKPTAEPPAAEKPAAEKPAAEKPAAEKPAAEKPAEKPAAEKPAAEKPAAEKPAAKPAEKPAAKPDKPAEKKKTDDKSIETPAWMQKDGE